ncbi:hypothetical protein GOP47_0024532 [Adiantum capillus-veneris]|uniref:Uncharacterized protein n=1 Tax=Adiantum capillus-veneris TaxID=13818 RepID=A0A9D4Z4G5_ADICA|nr:hypothetical protein GOP47_0024532 [Adiantum capillus-veneris]
MLSMQLQTQPFPILGVRKEKGRSLDPEIAGASKQRWNEKHQCRSFKTEFVTWSDLHSTTVLDICLRFFQDTLRF